MTIESRESEAREEKGVIEAYYWRSAHWLHFLGSITQFTLDQLDVTPPASLRIMFTANYSIKLHP